MVNTAVKSPVRFVAAALLVSAAAAHVPVIGDHLSEAPYIGVLFVALAVSCVTAAVLLVRADDRRLWMAVLGTCGAAVLAYVWSRSIGLPEIKR